LTDAERDHLLSRYRLPRVRLAMAEILRTHASAAMDVSDGLAGDLAKLCRVSQVATDVDVTRVPLSDAAKAVTAADPVMLETALTGGDDYEIVCTVPPKKVASFQAAAAKVGVPLTEIGVISKGSAQPRFLDSDGKPLTFKQLSFSHF
jgi:thiamine-monophosphate kinase